MMKKKLSDFLREDLRKKYEFKKPDGSDIRTSGPKVYVYGHLIDASTISERKLEGLIRKGADFIKRLSPVASNAKPSTSVQPSSVGSKSK